MSKGTSLLALPATLARDAPIGTVLEGTVIAGSWDASTATFQVQEGTSAAVGLVPSTGDQPLIAQVTVAVTQLGDQYAPVGGERVTLLRNGSGWIAFFEHADDDTQQVPAGERWCSHRNAAGEIDAFWKHTNDGPTPGDGLGGAYYGGNAALTKTTTKGGHQVTLDDVAKLLTILANIPGGTNVVKTIYDPVGNAISHVCPTGKVAVGDLVTNLSATTNAAYRFTDASSLATNLRQTMGNLAQQIAQAAVLAGVPNAAEFLAEIQSGLPSLSFVDILSSVAPVTVPGGSANVLIK